MAKQIKHRGYLMRLVVMEDDDETDEEIAIDTPMEMISRSKLAEFLESVPEKLEAIRVARAKEADALLDAQRVIESIEAARDAEATPNREERRANGGAKKAAAAKKAPAKAAP